MSDSKSKDEGQKKGQEVEIMGQVVPCPKIQVGHVSLAECVECKFFKGVDTVKENFNGFKIDDVLCAMPTRRRVSPIVRGVNNGGA